MGWEHIAIVLTAVISGAFGVFAKSIGSKPDRENNNIRRINDIVNHYERMHRQCEERYSRVCEENKALREKVRDLRHIVDKLREGGDN